MYYSSIVEAIGNTPLVRLRKINPNKSATILAKLEGQNPGGSVKTRIAWNMIAEAEARGMLRAGGMIIEATSGNTGIGLALVAASRGYQLILVMPESMSIERRKLLKLYGAQVILTPAAEGMEGAVKKANELKEQYPEAFMPRQFSNPNNPLTHYKTTGPEIWEQCGGKIDAFVVGVGTGGTLTGAGKYLREKNPDLKIYAVEPAGSPVLSGGSKGPHKIQGIGPGFVPEILDRSLIDQIITVPDDQAFLYASRLAEQEGILAGISSGAAAYAACKVADELGWGKYVVTVLPDTGERYLSVEGF
ncbi:MAG: cysteine synthase A [Firmicutes bacterium]|nr:cysteine synthase A [Bacillota bacterium]